MGRRWRIRRSLWYSLWPASAANHATRPASSTEILRVKRALYRREIVSAWAATGTRNFPGGAARSGQWQDTDIETINAGLLSLFEPWHMQQIVDVDNFLILLNDLLAGYWKDFLGPNTDEAAAVDRIEHMFFRLETFWEHLDRLTRTDSGHQFLEKMMKGLYTNPRQSGRHYHPPSSTA